jgi:hypothetical protein
MKVWALMMVVALAVFGWVLPAGAGKIQLTDQELDAVGAGDSAAAASQVGLGSANASSASNGIDGPTATSASVVVTNPTNAAAAASGANASVIVNAGTHAGTAGAAAGSNVDPLGTKGTKFSKLKAEWTPGLVQIGISHGLCKGVCP